MFGTRSRVRATHLSAQASGQPQEPPVDEQAELPVDERTEPPVDERTDTTDEEQGLNRREAGQDTKVADKPLQRLYSLYETPHSTSPNFRQSPQGERLLNWLLSIKPYRLRHSRSETNVQLLPELYTNTPPMSDLDTTITPLDQETLCHSAEASRVDEPASTSRVYRRPVQNKGYRETLIAHKVLMVDAEEKVPSDIQLVIDFITSERDQALDTEGLKSKSYSNKCTNLAKGAKEDEVSKGLESQAYSNKCTNRAINGANEDEVSAFFNDYLFSETRLPDGVRRNPQFSRMDKRDLPNHPKGASYLSIPHSDVLFGYIEGSFPLRHVGFLSEKWDDNTAKFPFLSVDYKGDGNVSNSSLWVATNQCLTATATCVNIITRLRDAAKTRGDGKVADKLDCHIFGLVASGTEARLFVTYAGKDGKTKYMKLIRGFLLYDTAHRVDLDRCVKNIFKWAEERKRCIEAAFDVVLKSSTAAPKRGHNGSCSATKRHRGRRDQRGESATGPPTDPSGV